MLIDGGQARRDHAERVADAQDGGGLAQMLDRVGRADLEFDLPARLVVALDGDQRLAHAALDQVLKCARDLFGALLFVRADQDRHLLDIGPGVLRREIAAQPGPDRVEGGARDAAAMLARGRVIDQERLERHEEQALRIAGFADDRGSLRPALRASLRSCSRISAAPGGSSPRSSARSSSAASSARASGFSSLRYFRSFSLGTASAMPHPHRFTYG